MKRILTFIIAVISVIIVFSGCNSLFPLDKDQFDLEDTVEIKVGEKLYENASLWVRLDSVTFDSRCPVGMDCFFAGYVNAWFTIGNILNNEQIRTDSGYVQYLCLNESYDHIFRLIDVKPERVLDSVIAQEDYVLSFRLTADMDVVKKPNIYLYPKTKTKLSVSLEFPYGGNVTVSDPTYPAAWQDMMVAPDGMINKEYAFLFYEAQLPDLWQYDDGWVIQREYLSGFFSDNLTKYGFEGPEIDDFIEYWIPRLTKAPFYAIYPQHTDRLNEVVPLKISKDPRSLLRLFYIIEASDEFFRLPRPQIPEFERKGFTVTEWGVVVE